MDDLTRHLDAPVDYSPELSARVSRIGEELSSLLSVPVSHSDDMNDNAGQRLGFYLLGDYTPTRDARQAVYSLGLWISSRGPLWTPILHHGDPGKLEWFPSPVASLRETPLLDSIDRFMASKELERIDESVLDQMVPGKETEMDGAPATVRDVLFCETC